MKTADAAESGHGGGGQHSGIAAVGRVQAADLARRISFALLGTLVGAVPAHTQAQARPGRHCGPICEEMRSGALPAGNARLSAIAPAAATATSSFALLHPERTFTVTMAADRVDSGDGKLSLREAVAQANATAAADRIVFARGLEGRTLVLTGGELGITQDLVIDGDGDAVAISGGDRSRILHIVGGETDVALRGLTLTHGSNSTDPNGAGIFVEGGRLTLSGSTIRDCWPRDDYGANNGGVNGGAISASAGSMLAIDHSKFVDNGAGYYGAGGAISIEGGSMTMEDSIVTDNGAYYGGGVFASDSEINIARSVITKNNGSYYGGGIDVVRSYLSLIDSTIAANRAELGGGLATSGLITLRGVTATGNLASRGEGGGGIWIGGTLDLSNSIVAGNTIYSPRVGDDVFSYDAFTLISDGHNVFGSDVAGAIAGDRQNVAPSIIFAAVDPETQGGKLSMRGIAPLSLHLGNPALSAANPLAASRVDQLGRKRPQPAGSLPDLGAAEAEQPLSTGTTVRNDVIAGNGGANFLAGWAGNDLIRGLAGNDTINAGPGSDYLDGGSGSNRLNGAAGVDIVTFAFSPVPVTVDLVAGIARRGGETDRLASIEGAVGTAAGDRLNGDEHDNYFQGRLGPDLLTGGAGRDTCYFDRVQDSPPGPGRRDVIADFTPGEDVLDLTRIDADATAPGEQSFRWVGSAPLSGPGQIGYVLVAGNTLVRASTDADPGAELEVELLGERSLTQLDVRP